MRCSSCGHDNPETANFCGECGSALATTVECAQCGTENPRAQKFCNGCGTQLSGAPPPSAPAPAPPEHLAEKIAATRDELAGERKQVTVLFADVQGSMDLAESVDAELWRTLMDRLLGTVSDAVHRYEGTVNKFTGDGAMALFGAPIAHEDHAVRACHAALHLRDALTDLAREVKREHGLNLPVRIGLNSGEVVVGAVGDDLHMDYTAIGHTVGLAARMEALSDPGRPYLTSGTAQLVEGWFELEDVGELRVKGVEAPVHAYALLGVGQARTRLDAAATRGLSQLVGRGRELAALGDALDNLDDGGQVVGVVAEAGVGKSRLCREFTERCRARGIDVTVGTGVAHGRRVPLLPVIQMMRGYFGIAEDDDARSARDKIAGRLLQLDASFRDALPIIFDFLGVLDPDGPPPQGAPEARQRALFGAVRRLVQARSDRGPGVILVEDLHWLDPGSDAFLANLIESLPGSPTLVVANFRPEYRADWMQKSYYQQIPLLPLDDAAVQDLVSSLIGTDPSVDGLAELIGGRTGGNPFFIEEVVQALLESGSLTGDPGAYRLARAIDDLEIPPTVQALLAARIDRLGELEKHVLGSAAVIGREFSEPVLRAVMGIAEGELAGALSALTSAELLYQRALYPEAQYAFKHPLTEEVAYRSQLGPRRARTHAAVARTLEELHDDRLDELAGVLSRHWEGAGDPVRAANWAARAATWAGQSHPADAVRHWQRVRKLAGEAPRSDETDALRLTASLWTLQYGWRLSMDPDEAMEVYREARELATAHGNEWALGAAEACRAIMRGTIGELDEALEAAYEAHRLAKETGDLELIVTVGPAYWLAVKGRMHEALEAFDESIEAAGGDMELGRGTFGFSSVVFSRFYRGMVLVDLGRIEEGRTELTEAIRLGTEYDDPESLGWCHSNWAILDYVTGEVTEGLAHAQKGFEIADRLGSAFSRQTAHWGLAMAYASRGEWQQAAESCEAADRMTQETLTGRQYLAWLLAILAEARRELGQPEAAREAAERGIELARYQGVPVIEARSRLQLGRLLAAEHPEGAQAELEHALGLAGPESLWLVPHIHEALGDLAGIHGREDERVKQLGVAHELYEKHGATGHARRIAEALAGATA